MKREKSAAEIEEEMRVREEKRKERAFIREMKKEIASVFGDLGVTAIVDQDGNEILNTRKKTPRKT